MSSALGNHLRAPLEPIARIFLCAECRRQVHLCSRCGRGQRYCHADCAKRARRRKQKAAQQRYQRSRRGRFCHALRARRYRARQKNVTHQGSNRPAENVLLVVDSAVSTHTAPVIAAGTPVDIRCAGCGCRCRAWVRWEFLRNRRIEVHNRSTFHRSD